MPATLPSNVALNAASVPPWAAQASTTLNNVLSAAWDLGQRTKQITILASQFNLTDFSPAVCASIDNFLNEYRAAGWSITIAASANSPSGRANSITFEFARF